MLGFLHTIVCHFDNYDVSGLGVLGLRLLHVYIKLYTSFAIMIFRVEVFSGDGSCFIYTTVDHFDNYDASG